MIVCSRCQFENPVHHRYCQECGALLVQDVASEQWPDDPVDSVSPSQAISRAGNGNAIERSPQDAMVPVQNEQETGTVLLAVCTYRPNWLTPIANPNTQLSISIGQIGTD